MPLDQIARRYADEMFNLRKEDILKDQRAKEAQNRHNHASRGLSRSGSIISEEGRIKAETILLLAESRAETLVKAYEKAGVPFDDQVVQEIISEIT